MYLRDLEKLIDEINERFAKIEGKQDLKDLMLKKTLKIGEEYGELCDAMLSELGSQRKSKIDSYSSDDFKEELADVIITGLTLARYMDIDLEELLLKKLKKIQMRLSDDKEY